jgi:hypothetical protein
VTAKTGTTSIPYGNPSTCRYTEFECWGIPLRLSVLIAEVLDKEAGLATIWLSHVLLAGLGYYLCRRDWRWLFAVVPLSTYAVWFGAVDLWDTSVGPAIFQESRSFFVQWHIAMALVVAAPLVGLWSGLSPPKMPVNGVRLIHFFCDSVFRPQCAIGMLRGGGAAQGDSDGSGRTACNLSLEHKQRDAQSDFNN